MAAKPQSKKSSAKKSAPAKKPAPSVKKAVSAKKPAPARKPVPARKPASAKKAVPVKKAAQTKKPAAPAKKPAQEPQAPARQFKAQPPNRVPLRLVKRVQIAPPKASQVHVVSTVGKPDTIAFAMSIAQEMKRTAKSEDAKRSENEIRLSRRPVSRKHGEVSNKFPEADLKEFKRRLLAARDQAVKGADAMKATGFNESDDREADGGDGTNQTLRLQALGQMGAINRVIQQIEEALHRIEDGTYGVCTVCGQLIRKPRLMNQPFVLTCMECQSEMERKRL